MVTDKLLSNPNFIQGPDPITSFHVLLKKENQRPKCRRRPPNLSSGNFPPPPPAAENKAMAILWIPEKRWFIIISAASLLFAFFMISTLLPGTKTRPFLCTHINMQQSPPSTSSLSPEQISKIILHYATNPTVPQQSKDEISISLNVLIRRRPVNFLVFGLGHDSRMWAGFNPNGYTLFLEEDLNWYNSVMKEAPFLNARHVKYSTQLKEADELLRTYRKEKYCLPNDAYVKGNEKCRLALWNLPEEVYEREWDLIMIDAPKGYFPEAPGRMAAIWTAAVMARGRKGEGDTDVFLHDVDRKVEKTFAMEFLCKQYKVDGSGRLWHFQIPNKAAMDSGNSFC